MSYQNKKMLLSDCPQLGFGNEDKFFISFWRGAEAASDWFALVTYKRSLD